MEAQPVVDRLATAGGPGRRASRVAL